MIKPPIRPELLDELLKDYQKPEDLLGQDGLLRQLTKSLVERALDGELSHHPGYEKHSSAGDNSGNSRNGTTPKTMRGRRGQAQTDVPRERNSEFEPQLVKKGQTRFGKRRRRGRASAKTRPAPSLVALQYLTRRRRTSPTGESQSPATIFQSARSTTPQSLCPVSGTSDTTSRPPNAATTGASITTATGGTEQGSARF